MNSSRIFRKIVWLSMVSCSLMIACQKEDKKDDEEKLLMDLPSHFPKPHYNFDNNPLSESGIALGKKLFYDTRLSVNATISCGTCHVPFDAFAQANHTLSHGVYDRLGRRNSPTLANMAWMTSFFHDGGVVDLDLQPIQPITAHEEMAQDFSNLPDILRADPDYVKMFRDAFGDENITNTNLLKALSQFMVTLVSANSKYDQFIKGEITYSPSQLNGYQLFKTHCNECHQEPLFTDYSFRNNGLEEKSELNDKGRYEITRLPSDLYKFKVPTLRNLQYTFPYMHDGRFTTLDEVLEHYASEIPDLYGTLDPILKKTGPAISLNEEEKSDLIAFLNTLNDREFVLNERNAE